MPRRASSAIPPRAWPAAPVRTALAGVGLLAATLLGLALLTAAPAAADHYTNTVENGAAPDDPVGTAAAYAELAFADGASEALLTRVDVFADALASGPLQATRPLLYTDGDALDPRTAAALDELGVGTVHVLGGTGAISEDVEETLAEDYVVERIAGPTRVETAVAIARVAGGERVLLARAFGDAEGDETRAWADALTAGAWAAETGWPVLLTDSEELSAATAAYLDEAGVRRLVAVGGPAAIADAALDPVRARGIVPERVWGPTRFATAVAVAQRRGAASEEAPLVLVDGAGAASWPDGLAAAAYSGAQRASVLLANVRDEALPPVTAEFLDAAAAAPETALVLGSTVPGAQRAEAAERLGQVRTAQTTVPAQAGRGQVLSAEFTWAEHVEALAVSGPEIVDDDEVDFAVHGEAPNRTGAFELTVARTAAPGPVTVTLEFTHTNGQRSTDRQTVEIVVPDSLTDAPELVAAELVEHGTADGEAVSVVRLRFDEDVGLSGEPEDIGAFDLSLVGPDTLDARVGLHDADSDAPGDVRRDPDDAAALLATFPRAGSAAATTAAAAHGAVEDVDGLGNLAGSAALQPLVVDDTRAADLVSVDSGAGGEDQARFAFDAALDAVLDEQAFGVVRADGSVLTSARASRSGDFSVLATFDEAIGAVRRGALVEGAVRDEEEGIASPPAAVAVREAGRTAAPDLVSVRLAPDDDEIVLRFDERVRSDELDAAAVAAVDVRGGLREGAEAERTAEDEVTIALAAGAVAADVVAVVVHADAVQGFDSGLRNASDAAAVPQAFRAGRTLGPRLVDVQIEAGAVTSTATFRFDGAVDEVTSERFAVSTEDGERHAFLSGLCTADGAEVACATTAAGAAELVADAAAATVGYDAARADAVVAYPNVATRIEILE